MARAASWPTHFDRLKLSTARFMYIFGDCRSDTLLPCAIRSRSRWRIFSRSSATAFMRLRSVSVDQKRHRQRQHRGARRDGGEQHGERLAGRETA